MRYYPALEYLNNVSKEDQGNAQGLFMIHDLSEAGRSLR